MVQDGFKVAGYQKSLLTAIDLTTVTCVLCFSILCCNKSIYLLYQTITGIPSN